jgi:hypothetical protein
MQLHEEYRPKQWSEVIGQDKVIARIGALRKRGLAGRAYWISGRCTGKTTVAQLIAAEVAGDFNPVEIDAGDLGMLPKVPDMHPPRRAKGQTLTRGRAISGEEFDRLLLAVPKVRPHDARLCPIVVADTGSRAGRASVQANGPAAWAAT